MLDNAEYMNIHTERRIREPENAQAARYKKTFLEHLSSRWLQTAFLECFLRGRVSERVFRTFAEQSRTRNTQMLAG